MTTIEIIGQIIGLFGVAVLFLVYQMKDRKMLLLLQMLGVALFARNLISNDKPFSIRRITPVY